MSEKDIETENIKKEPETLAETLSNIVADVVETVAETAAAVVETVAEAVKPTVVEKVETAEDNSAIVANAEPIAAAAAEPAAEERVGYAAVELPQSDESEPETAVVEADDKPEIEAAIARARETHAETEAEITDELVADRLPDLPRFNRARLQVQSPTRIFLYWSLAGNPWETLSKAFGKRAGNYTLALRLTNLGTNAESYAPANQQGSWWYNVRSNQAYQIDLGFYAANRPFIRLLSSNQVNTPRSAPSLRVDSADDWQVTTPQFTQALADAGYSHEVGRVNFADAQIGVIESRNAAAEDLSTLVVANRLAPAARLAAGEINFAELRWLLATLAAGASFANARAELSEELTAWLADVLRANPEAMSAANIQSVLESVFGADYADSFTTQAAMRQSFASIAVGASRVNFGEVSFPEVRFPELRFTEEGFPEINFRPEDYPELAFPTSAEFLN